MVTSSNDREDASTIARGFSPPQAVAFDVEVEEGVDRGAALAIEPSERTRFLVGQSPACALRLSDPLVSRRHFALELADDGLHLTDLGSTNRTFVGDLAVVEVVLGGGERIRAGDTVLRVARRAASAQPASPGRDRFGKVLGASPQMQSLYPLCDRLARADIPALIEGETGTGKEVLAESLHEASARAEGPFVVFDCTAVPASLLESALFGHEAGAFTGATAARKGVFEQAHGGTLLIDEIGDLDIALQPKLLRAIERREIQRVGGSRWLKVDVRVLSATRRDLDREIQAGRFRDDLFFRIAVARIELPPLRHRDGDIARLARAFWDALGGAEQPIPVDAFRRYEREAWPGNVRELHNAVVRRLALGALDDAAPRSSLRPAAVAPNDEEVDAVLRLDLPLPIARQRVIAWFERRYLERVLDQHHGNVAAAATSSGIARRYFSLLRVRRGL